MSRYLVVLRRRGVFVAFLAATVARMPVSMAGLGAVLLVQQERDSYALAGAITACFALANAAGAPVWGRLLDRFGQPPVVGPTAVSSALLLASFALAVVDGAAVGVLVALATASGLAFPPITPAMRAAWQHLLPNEADRHAAYALDAVAVELVFVVGPVLLSLLIVTAPAAVPLLVTACLLGFGSLAYIATPAARAPGARARRERADAAARADSLGDAAAPVGASPSPLRSPRLLAVLLIATAMAMGFGQLDVSVAATARETLQNQALLGLLFTAVALGSASGGLWYGARTWRLGQWQVLPLMLGGFAAGLVVLVVVAGLARGATPVTVVTLVVTLFATGLCIAPSLIMQQNLIDELAHDARRSEAQSWLSTGITAGAAGGTAIAGVLIQHGGPALGFAGAAVALALAVLLVLVSRPADIAVEVPV